jgi:tetratricopeptide (TPR) repeat protein
MRDPWRVIVVIAVLGLLVASAHGDEGDLQTARRHFAAGAQFYDTGDFRRALEEFLTAQRLYRVPAFDFNIGRCYDRLGEREPAIEHYRSYVATRPADAAGVQARIDELDRELAQSRPAPPPPRRKRRTLAIVLGTVAGALVAGTAVALGVTLGRATPDYSPSTLGPVRVTP